MWVEKRGLPARKPWFYWGAGQHNHAEQVVQVSEPVGSSDEQLNLVVRCLHPGIG